MYATMKTTPQSSKRPLEDKEEEPTKKFKPNTLKHVSLNCNLSSDDTVKELFEQVRIIGVDDVTYTGARHYHIIGIPKLYKRAARDVSRISLEQMGISHHLAKQAYNSMHFTDIGSEDHYNNTINYIKKKRVIYEDEEIKYQSGCNRILDRIRQMKQPKKFSDDDMSQFRLMYPEPNDWHKDVVALKLQKSYVDQLEQMEAQR